MAIRLHVASRRAPQGPVPRHGLLTSYRRMRRSAGTALSEIVRSVRRMQPGR